MIPIVLILIYDSCDQGVNQKIDDRIEMCNVVLSTKYNIRYKYLFKNYESLGFFI